MKNKLKVATGVVIVVIILVSIYNLQKDKSSAIPTSSETVELTNEEELSQVSNNETSPSGTSEATAPVEVSANTLSQQIVPTASFGTLIYKGEFFPFQFSYPSNFKLAKSTASSNKDRESKSYNFSRIALDGGIGGYVSFYVTYDNDNDLQELVKSFPEKYSTTKINENIFYKYTEKDGSSNNAYRVEYTTFKNDVAYRFSLVVVNGDRKDLDISTYKPELDMFDSIIKSLKIN